MSIKRIALGGLLLALVAGLLTVGLPAIQGQSQGAAYTPQTRNFTVVTVPTLTHESAEAMPSYAPVVKHFGEIFTFFPDVLVVYQGDTVNVTIKNLQIDDPHTFTMSAPYDNVNVAIGPNSTQKVSFKATDVGTFEFYCTVPGHLPYMYGELVVLPDSMGGGYQNKQ